MGAQEAAGSQREGERVRGRGRQRARRARARAQARARARARAHLLVSVLPAPDSPLTTIDCGRLSFLMRWYDSSDVANTCGVFFEIGLLGK